MAKKSSLWTAWTLISSAAVLQRSRLEQRRKADASGVATVTVVVGGYRALPKSIIAITRRANSAKLLRSSMPAKLYVYETILKQLAYNLKHMAFEFGPVVSAQKPVMGQGCRFRGRAANCKRRVLEILRRRFEESLIYIQSRGRPGS
jgi:hypothetical protein